MERSLVLTMDVITPIVDDPRAFGAIAAANAMSDVYAMGGLPELALSFVGFPTDKLPLAMLAEVLAGMQEACARAGCAIVGGHTIADNEPKAGLAVVGSVKPTRVWSHRSAREGDALVLSKPLGTGIVGQAIRAGKADEDLIARATAQMMALNAPARDVGKLVGASSCTDVTGFGLLGHLRNIVEASDLAATLYATHVPLIEGALELAWAGLVPGGSKRNLAYVSAVTAFESDVDEALRLLLADAQTSGGLLLCVPASEADTAVRKLKDAGCEGAAAVGVLERATGGPRIRVAR
jgi:selenide,water dikinase